MSAWWLSEPTTEGREHWYLVCVRNEAQASLVGPFFDLADAEEEEQVVKVNNDCELPHLTRKGPVPAHFLIRCRRPLVYDLDADKRDWWEAWAYDRDGEKERTREALGV